MTAVSLLALGLAAMPAMAQDAAADAGKTPGNGSPSVTDPGAATTEIVVSVVAEDMVNYRTIRFPTLCSG